MATDKPKFRHQDPPDVKIPVPDYVRLQAADAEWAAWAAAGNNAAQGRKVWPPIVRLSPAEQDIVDVIREAGGKADSQGVIFDALSAKGKIPSEGTTKITLAALVRHGILQTGPGGKGYTLP